LALRSQIVQVKIPRSVMFLANAFSHFSATSERSSSNPSRDMMN
jgi:hypothetical protein